MPLPTDTRQPPSPPPPPTHNPGLTSSDTPHSDSGRSFSSTSSGEIMSTPFDLGAQRFEYPFPQTQGSPTDAFAPLSSAITRTPHSHAQLPSSWPIHISKSFPLTPPPLGKSKAHPKLRSANAREPPVPPGLVKRKTRIPGIKHQSSEEEPSDKSDVGDDVARARRSLRFIHTLTTESARKPHPPDDPSTTVLKHAASCPIRSFDRPGVQNIPGLAAMRDAHVAERPPRLQVVSTSTYTA
ncbi:hypothetical protein V8E55_003499 [Tylopilus felleus]